MDPDQDIDALMRYHQAHRVLLASTLLPISMGCLYAADDMWTGQAALFTFQIWFLASCPGLNAVANFLVHCTEASLLEKRSRWLSLLRQKIAHQLAGYFGAACLLVLLHALHGQELLPSTPPEWSFGLDDAFRKQHVLFLLFWTMAFIPVMGPMMVDKPRKRKKWWLAPIVICFVFEPLGRYLFLLPLALALPLYLAGMSARTPERRDSLIINAFDAALCSTVIIFFRHCHSVPAMDADAGGSRFDRIRPVHLHVRAGAIPAARKNSPWALHHEPG